MVAAVNDSEVDRAPAGFRGTLARLLAALVFALLAFVLRRRVIRHLRFVRGLRNLPAAGPLLIVANHQSYFDNFVIAGLVWMFLGRRVWVPTKAKAFRGRLRNLLHRAAGAFPIDPDRPDEAYAAIGAYLARGEVVLVFPEGTRSDGRALRPFRFGAFNLAARANVPVLPVALRDTGRVIPAGRYWFRKGEKASAVLGEMLDPRAFAAAAGGDAGEAARRMRDEAEAFIAGVVAADEAALFDRAAVADEAAWLGDYIDGRIEGLLDKGVEQITGREARDVMTLARLALCLDPDSLRFRTQYLRGYGFRVRSLPRLVALLFVPGLKRQVRSALEADRTEPFLNYTLGQLNLQVPRVLGGSKREAALCFSRAYDNARSHGADPARFAVPYAAALAVVGLGENAAGLLTRHFGTPAEDESPRRQRRRARAMKVMAQLQRGNK